MRPTILFREILTDVEIDREDRDRRIHDGVATVYQVAKAAFGPKAGNVLIEQSWGDPKLSRDGVTNVQKIFLKDHVANMAARVLVQASKKNNQTVGDGTTGAVILAYHLYNEGRKLVAAGHNRMAVSRMIEEAADKAIEQVKSVSQDIDDDKLLKVSRVSSGDDALGDLIADTVREVGSDSGVIVEEHGGVGTYNEIIDGFYMRKGFTDIRLVDDIASLKSDFANVPIILLDKTISESREMKTIIEKVVALGHTKMVIMGDVVNEALDALIRRRIPTEQNPNPVVATLVGIPSTAGMKSIVLEDLAILTGGKVYQNGQKASLFDKSYLGAAERVLIQEHSTIIVGGAGDEEAIKERLEGLEKQLDAETETISQNALRDRVAHLRGKVGIIRVGGATDVDREELRLRVDDAVCALQAARKGGVVPGGGTTLARVTGTTFDKVFQSLFLDLMENAGDNGQLKLGKVQASEVGYGYDLKNPTDEPLDLIKAGVVDPTMVVTELVRNAASVASKLITVTTTITFTDEGVQV